MTYLKPAVKRPQADFSLGRIVITNGASLALHLGDIATAILRHARGDWGDVSRSDWEANDLALQGGGRLLSVYHNRKGVAFWVITEATRSLTTVLLPEDY